MNEDLARPIKLNEFAKLLNVSTRTLQRWDKEGILVAHRTPTNRRYYTYSQYLTFIKKRKKRQENVILYSRVLLEEQEEELKRQEEELFSYAKENNFKVVGSFKDVDNGLHFEREGFKALINKIINSKIDKVIIVSEDILTLFYYSWFKEYFSKYGTEIISIGKSKITKDDIIKEISHINQFINK